MLNCRLGTMGLKIWPKNLMLGSDRGRWGLGEGTLSHAEDPSVSVIVFMNTKTF